MRISVIPEDLHYLSGRLRDCANQIRAMQSRLAGQWSGLDWETQRKSGAEHMVHAALNRARVLADHADDMARFLASKADGFSEADAQSAAAWGRMGESVVVVAPVTVRPPHWRLPGLPWLGRQMAKLSGFLLPLIPGALLVSLRPLAGSPIRLINEPTSLLNRLQAKLGARPATPTGTPSSSAPRTWTEKQILGEIESSPGRLPGQTGQQCVDWAKRRRQSLGASPLPAISTYSPKDWGAHNYIRIFGDSAVPITPDDVSGTGIAVAGLRPGAALVWDRGHPGLEGTAGYTYGHVAVVEAVQADGVWVSQANWPGEPAMFIPNEKMRGLHVVPLDAKPISPEDF